MSEAQSPPPDGHRHDAPAVEVEVTRTGGFAGLRREWRAAPAPEEQARWLALIERCPWDDAPRRPPTGVDRFTWCLRARCIPGPDRMAELAEDDVTGAWRDLIDQTRAWTRRATGDPPISG